MRTRADEACRIDNHMYAGFADGNVAGSYRGAVCFNQVRGSSIKKWSMHETVKQSPGWWAISAQAEDYCKQKGYKTGMPSSADSSGNNAYNYCFEDNDEVVKDLTAKLKSRKDIVKAREKALNGLKK